MGFGASYARERAGRNGSLEARSWSDWNTGNWTTKDCRFHHQEFAVTVTWAVNSVLFIPAGIRHRADSQIRSGPTGTPTFPRRYQP